MKILCHILHPESLQAKQQQSVKECLLGIQDLSLLGLHLIPKTLVYYGKDRLLTPTNKIKDLPMSATHAIKYSDE
jgi:hypothetical protein